jgi:hypothetical protein
MDKNIISSQQQLTNLHSTRNLLSQPASLANESLRLALRAICICGGIG